MPKSFVSARPTAPAPVPLERLLPRVARQSPLGPTRAPAVEAPQVDEPAVTRPRVPTLLADDDGRGCVG